MSEAPLNLDDADFTDDAPPGYWSYKLKERYTPLMITVLVITFLAQMVLPFVIAIASTPLIMMQTMAQSLPQYDKLTAWRDALWYPTLDGPGGGRGGGKVQALDYQGKPLDKPAIETDTQPEWLLADGDRLWAVSKNELAEILGDGSRPVVMHPTRYLEHASPPFLYEGRLAVVDFDQASNWGVYVLENGEWALSVKLQIPDFTPQTQRGVDPTKPADALFAENASPRNHTSQAQFAQPKKTGTGSGPFTGYGQQGSVEQVIVVPINGQYHVAFSQWDTIYHRVGLPMETDPPALSDRDAWHKVLNEKNFPNLLPSDWALTAVVGLPAILVQSKRGSDPMQLWQFRDGTWTKAAELKTITGNGQFSQFKVKAFTTPAGDRTFAVIDQFNGMSHVLLELHADRIEKIKTFDGMFGVANPMSSGYIKMQIASNLSVYVPLIVQVLLVTWLMRVHRDPNYYKGRTAVEYASVLRRVIALFFDWLIVNVPLWLGWYLWYGGRDLDFMEVFESLRTDPRAFLLSLVPVIAATLGWILLWGIAGWLMTAFGGFTPGKLLCGVRVVKTNLEAPGLLKALIRLILWVVEMAMFNGILAFVLIAFTQNRQRLADLVAGTVVVKARSLRRARAELAAAS